ncbi:pyridoxamine 5'-phosphate oxidase family protein [Streptomyces sp. RFCAC02]|uniref:helix-turn-helix domain-containing protein n=1 Tax=Streptomyces sp. RFCAC02 TaxID=2499143 RepID=UPI00101F4044|nr:pyridoxamine 5'-phosphate oxidase family protein [Streptomyces sp. RFCAC02]
MAGTTDRDHELRDQHRQHDHLGRARARHGERNHRGDVGRRVAMRREELGLTRQDVADRARVDPEYLRYLEEQPASPTFGSLTRVARALDTTVAELNGAREVRADTPRPAGTGELIELGTDECYDLLARHSVGRVAVTTPDGPAIVPAGYRLIEGAVLFRTSSAAPPPFDDDMAFEVDLLDEAEGVGWSVQVLGRATRVTDPGLIARLDGLTGHRPWSGAGGELWVRLRPVRVSGHRLRLRPAAG